MELTKVSAAIVERFPTELASSYYVPSSKGKSSQGKLYDAYNSLRTDLAEVKLITRREKTTKGTTIVYFTLRNV